ncbi:MAG: MFS transporter [Clostridia bacterium]|nr:MFS transporter [Clostridia bacterium]
MKLTYKHTVLACYIGYIASATVNNLASLLFIVFQEDFGLSTVELATIITFNFLTQIFVDLFGAKFVDKIGYRRIAIIASVFLIAGLISLGVLPITLDNTFLALCIASVIYAIGSGLEEVIISPIVEALPGEHKESAMSILHSFYCWGHVGMVLLSTLYLVILPEKWFILPILWAIVPVCSLVLFCGVPIRTLNEDSAEHSMPLLSLFKNRLFWLFMILMLCGGASEQVIAQWSSLFAESELGVSKLMGNLLGPCFFALMMAITRTVYGKKAEKLSLPKALILSSVITVIGYLTVCLVPTPYVALIGCGIVGVGVSLYWPGVISISAKALPAGGASMFAILAMFGDLGCSVGPQMSAFVAELFGGQLKIGLLASLIFPVIIGVSLLVYIANKNKKEL